MSSYLPLSPLTPLSSSSFTSPSHPSHPSQYYHHNNKQYFTSSEDSTHRYLTPNTSNYNKRRSYLTSEDSLTPIKTNLLETKYSERTGLLSGQKVIRKTTPIESILGRNSKERKISNLEGSLDNDNSNHMNSNDLL